MKNKNAIFFFLLILIISFPVAINYKVLLFGEKVQGEVLGSKFFQGRGKMSNYFRTIVSYEVNDVKYEMYSIKNADYYKGERLTLKYNPDNPSESIIFDVFNIALQPTTSISIFLIVIWIAAFFSIKEAKQDDLKERWLNPNG
ncbi:MAG: DUF3592 domain-containing protein [Cryomorphaceae bacterium]|nr:DUF3592 domain-containing protein [Cryomorphaceae bacterium]